jgi:hypothetical protein
MAVLHTPRCRINWTNVAQGARQDRVKPYESFALNFGMTWDPNIRISAGQFNFHFTIFDENGVLVYDWIWKGWTPTELPSLPANCWLSHWWPQAIYATGRGGFFQFRPSVYFQMGGIGQGWWDEFAVAEEDHFFVIDTT